MKQLARAREREYLFTNNPLITSDGQRDQTRGPTQELALNETGLKIQANPPYVAAKRPLLWKVAVLKTRFRQGASRGGQNILFLLFFYRVLFIIKHSRCCNVYLRVEKY